MPQEITFTLPAADLDRWGPVAAATLIGQHTTYDGQPARIVGARCVDTQTMEVTVEVEDKQWPPPLETK